MPYQGVWAEISLGSKGVQTDLPSSELPHDCLIKAVNVSFTPGYIEKAHGAIRHNLSPLTAGLIACTDFWLDGLTQRTVVATADGKLWKDNGDRTFSNHTPLITGLGTLNNQCSFTVGGAEAAANPKKAFFFSNGVQQIYVVSGDNNVPHKITQPAADWNNGSPSTNPSGFYPRFGIIHRSRLWVFMKSNYYGSNTTDHEDFVTAEATLTGTVGPGEGGDVIGAFVYKGQMLVFKQGDFVYQLVDTDPSSDNWYFKKFAEGFSIANAKCSAQVLDDLIAVNSTSTLTSYKATQAYGNFTQGDLYKSQLVSQYFRQYTSRLGTPYMQATFYPEKGQAFFTARSGAFTYNDTVITFDVSTPSSPKFSIWNHYQADCISMQRDINNILRPIYGGTDGYLYLAGRETRAVNGNGYLAEFKTPYIDFRFLDGTYGTELSEKQKQFELLGVTFTPDGNHNLNVDVWIDGKFSETVSVSQVIDTNFLGSFKLGTSLLGIQEEQTVFVPIHGAGRRLSLRGYNGNAYESFRVSKFGIGFRILGEDATRIAAP